jgi:hypothetical protein
MCWSAFARVAPLACSGFQTVDWQSLKASRKFSIAIAIRARASRIAVPASPCPGKGRERARGNAEMLCAT